MNRQQRRQEMRSVRRAKRTGDSLDLGIPSVTDLYQRGFDDHRAGRLSQAQVAYRQILTIDPAHADAHNNLGNTLRDLGRPAEAEASYREALRLRPNYPEAHYNLGNALYALGRPAEAEASYRDALRLRPNLPEAHYNLGNTLYDLDRPAEAEASYREALRLRPNDPEAHNNLGNALCDLGRPAEAEASIERALALKPDYAEALYARGTSLHALNRWRESIACFERLLSLTPHDLATKLALCMAELPILYADEAEIAERRASYAAHLNSLAWDMPHAAALADSGRASRSTCRIRAATIGTCRRSTGRSRAMSWRLATRPLHYRRRRSMSA